MFELSKAVGNNLDNRPEDVFKIKDTLSDVGLFDFDDNPAEPHGIFTCELRDGIRDFQKDNGLRVDGILKPKGRNRASSGAAICSARIKGKAPKWFFLRQAERIRRHRPPDTRSRSQDF